MSNLDKPRSSIWLMPAPGQCGARLTSPKEPGAVEYVPASEYDELLAYANKLPCEAHLQLFTFYDVDTLEKLVDVQAKHIRQLQEKLRPYLPDLACRRTPREG